MTLSCPEDFAPQQSYSNIITFLLIFLNVSWAFVEENNANVTLKDKYFTITYSRFFDELWFSVVAAFNYKRNFVNEGQKIHYSKSIKISV